MPEGYGVAYRRQHRVRKISVEDVIQTLFEAIILVVVVMYLFLQNIRATLIGAGIPVVSAGHLWRTGAVRLLHQHLTLFAMVLAIGLLVDDAIVVVKTSTYYARRRAAARKPRKVDGQKISVRW